MESYELDIDSYTLDDLLGVFKIELPLTDLDIENARRRMLSTHPDKSGLDGSIFVFFKSAYQRLSALHGVQSRMSREASVDYKDYLEETNAGLESFSKRSDFGSHFNKVFEQHIGNTFSQPGHGDWLAATTDAVDSSSAEDLLRLKRTSRALVAVEDIVGWGGGAGCELLEPSKVTATATGLAFQDVRDAYTKGVIAVTEEEDFQNRRQYASVEELERDRVTSISGAVHAHHEEKLRKQRIKENMQDVEYAYKLQERDRSMQNARRLVDASLLQIKGK